MLSSKNVWGTAPMGEIKSVDLFIHCLLMVIFGHILLIADKCPCKMDAFGLIKQGIRGLCAYSTENVVYFQQRGQLKIFFHIDIMIMLKQSGFRVLTA